jgi:hypothetical protein
MHRLIVVLAIVGASFGVGVAQPPSAEAQSSLILAMTFHPTGSASNSAILTCGWHDICDASYPDTYSKGLDWVAQGGSTSTWVRIWNYGGPSSSTWVARMNSSMPTTGCYRIASEVKRISDGAIFGSVVNQHSRRTGSAYANLFSRSGGYQNPSVVGSFVPLGQDNCTTEGPHTMQWYASGDYDTESGKNGGVPKECLPNSSTCCYSCNKSYSIWLTYEWYFRFYS